MSVETLAQWIPLKCPLFVLTGIHCPTCGLGRGILAALSGDWKLSIQYHPLAIPFLFLTVLSVAGFLMSPIKFKLATNRVGSFIQSHKNLASLVVLLYSLWGITRWYL